jgi:DNA-binding CsgD family transcriptional regulator
VTVLLRLVRHAAEARRLRAAVGQSPAAADSVRNAAMIGITPREMTVLSLLAQGHTAAAVGRRLGIRVATLSKHQENLYRKLGTRDRLTTVLTAQPPALLAVPWFSETTRYGSGSEPL